MEVILRQEIEKLGHPGQVVRVKAGYARNYLLPRNLAVPATEANKKIVEQERQSYLRKQAKLQGEAEELAKLMASVSVTIKAKAGEAKEGEAAHLFGSVTVGDIAASLEAQGFKIDRKKIVLKDPIRYCGEYKVPVKLHREVTLEVPVHVVKDGE
jgi:large subunit ribosomal protein L9